MKSNELNAGIGASAMMYGSEDDDEEDMGGAGFLDEFEQHQMNKNSRHAHNNNNFVG